VSDAITVAEIARALGVTTRQVLYLIHAGRLPGAEKINDLPNAPYIVPRRSFEALQRAREDERRGETTGRGRKGR
jgi:hypothetical protein